MSTEGERQQERRSVACWCGVLRIGAVGCVERTTLECQPAARDGKRAMPIAEQMTDERVIKEGVGDGRKKHVHAEGD